MADARLARAGDGAVTERVHDVLVVGSGIAGLTAAALAAAEGADTVVLEGHTRPGGCAADFPRRGIMFPAGATLMSGFEPGGLHAWVYRRLGLPIRARRLDRAMTVHLPDRTVSVPTDAAAWTEERRRAFPELGRRGERFWRRMATLAARAHALASRRPTLPITTLGELVRAAALASPGVVAALPALTRTVGDELRAAGIWGAVAHRRFVDSQLLISMQCLADEAVALNGALALELYRFGCFYLAGGTATVARDLVQALSARGGTIRYRSWVRSLRRRDELWVAETAEGERYRARAVVANVPPSNLVGLLGDEAPSRLTRRATRDDVGWGAVVLHAAIERRGLDGPWPRYHQTVADPAAPLEEGNGSFVSLYLAEDSRRPDVVPLTVSTHTRVEPWLDATDRAAYVERKYAYADRLLAAAEVAVPDIRARLRFAEVATPRSFLRWTGRHRGRVGGLPQTRAHANFAALSHRVGPPGLFICGDTVFPGQGTIGVTLSGINAARDAVARARGVRRAGRPNRVGVLEARVFGSNR